MTRVLWWVGAIALTICIVFVGIGLTLAEILAWLVGAAPEPVAVPTFPPVLADDAEQTDAA